MLDRILNAVVVIICILILLVSLYSLLDNHRQMEEANDTSVLVYKPNLEKLGTEEFVFKKINENHKAWLSVDDTNIDYPIMQGESNLDYLNYDPYGNFRLSGSIFLDCTNSPDFSDDYSLIYGHHIRAGAMFGTLDFYKDRSFFDSHRSGWIVVDNGTAFDFEVFAVMSIDASDKIIFRPAEQTTATILDFLRESAMIFEEPEEGLRLVALSTCAGNLDRLVVFGTIRER